MKGIETQSLERYLQETLGEQIKLRDVGEIGSLSEEALKQFGYGKSLRVIYERDGREEQAVFDILTSRS